MSDFIDYVYCRGVDGYQTKHLFQTKAWSGLAPGDIVFAAGCGTAAFSVLTVKTIKKESEFDSFIHALYEDKEVKKLAGKMIMFEDEED